jgi:hypothetical protein
MGRMVPQRFAATIEIREKGYGGKAAMVRTYVRRLRTKLTKPTPEQRMLFLGTRRIILKAPTSRSAAWWLLKQEEELSPKCRAALVERLRHLCPQAKEAQRMVRESRETVGERRPEALGWWFEAATHGQVAEMEGFAQGLSKDYEVVSRWR